jgi:hypothetical protein
MSGDVVTELFAFVALDDSDGNEGVMAFYSDGSWIPMIGADMARIESLIPLAEKIEKETGAKFEIRHFSLTGTLKR